MDDPALYAAKYQAYVEDRKTYKAESSAWRENSTRAYMTFTAHCPEGLLEELKQVPGWDAVESTHDVIGLLTKLRDLAHGKKVKKQGTMAKVEADLALMMCMQSKTQTLNEYAKIFNAQVEVINANGGQAGYNAELVEEHLKALLKAADKTAEDYLVMQPADRKALLDKAGPKRCFTGFRLCFVFRFGREVQESRQNRTKNKTNNKTKNNV